MRDSWVKNDMVFICDGQGFTVSPLGLTVCIGPVDDGGNPLEDIYKPPETAQDEEEAVTKIADNGILPPADSQNGETGIMLQEKKRGRPRKGPEESVTRMTEYRHRKEKEKQGVLL